MLNQIVAIAKKELKVLTHDRGALVGLFLLPIAFILVMTNAEQGLFNSGSADNPIYLPVVNEDRGPVAAKVIADLKGLNGLTLVDQQDGSPLTRAQAEDLIVSGKYSMVVVFPSDFSRGIQQAGLNAQAPKTSVTFITDPAISGQLLSQTKGIVQGYVEREASLAQSPERLASAFDRMAASASNDQAAAIRRIGAQFTSQLAGSPATTNTDSGVVYNVISPAKFKSFRSPTSAEQNVPGYTIYGVFFIMQTIATGLFREKNEGTFRRIQAAPLGKAAFLAGKLLPYYLINLAQIAIMFLVGILVFHIGLGNDPAALIVLALATSAAATGLGLLLASLGKTLEQVGSLSTLLSVVLAAVGGMMVPVSIMPHFMQTLALATPHAWALNGFQDVIVRGLGLQAVLPQIGVLMAFAAFFWGVAIWRFQYD